MGPSTRNIFFEGNLYVSDLNKDKDTNSNMQDVDMKGKLNNPFSALLVQESLWKVGNKTGIYLQ